MPPTKRILDRPLHSARYLASFLGIPLETLRELAGEASYHYAPFTQHRMKDNKPKKRKIDNPRKLLKFVQKVVKKRLLDTIVFPSFVHGGVRKRSTQTNARRHIRRPEVVALDIRGFFGHVTPEQVSQVWRSRFQTGHDTTWLLTRLTTFQSHLPQGAPTSTALANLVILPAMHEINQYCRERRLALSVYVDDICISGRNARSAIPFVSQVLSRSGFSLARKKIRVMPSNVRQEVTGHTVNRRLSNSRKTLARARQLIFLAMQNGADEADFVRARGLVAHVNTTSPSQGRWLVKMLGRAAARDTSHRRTSRPQSSREHLFPPAIRTPLAEPLPTMKGQLAFPFH
jgi:hypothetical protein